MKHLARELRSNPTEAESILWGRIRKRQLEGVKFRRQQGIGRYIVDFVCLEKSLVVEIDGGGHALPEKEKQDAVRTKWLESQGYRVVRYWNDEVVNRTDDVVLDLVRQLNR